MQINEIQAFLAICDLGSFRAAAQQLHLTQPAVSKRLLALESRLGHRLLDRVSRGSALTEAGRAYLPHARRLLIEVDNSNRALDNLNDEIKGQLSLALSHHIALHRIPSILRAFVKKYPQVDVNIEFMGSEAACQEITQGRIELGVITLPQPPAPRLEQHEIWRDSLQVLVAPEHPLARQKNIKPQALAQYPALLPDESTYTHRVIAQALAPYGVVPQLRQTSNYLETLKMLAGIGLGWTALPDSMVDSSLQALNFTGLKLERSLGAVRHPQRSLSNAANALLELLGSLESSD